MNKTQIFDSYMDFQQRSDKALNGVSKEFAEKNPDYTEANKDSQGCYNCSDCSRCSDCFGCSRCFDCSDCSDCSRCSDCSDCSDCFCCKVVPKGAVAASLTGVYKYTCSPRIHKNGEQWIQMGCYLRLRDDWEKDFWNNPKEFPNNDDQPSKDRWLAFQMASMWLDANARKEQP